MDQPTFNSTQIRLTHRLSEPSLLQPTFKKIKFFQPNST